MTVSLATLTAEPVEVFPRPALASELDARLRARSDATAVALAAVVDFAAAFFVALTEVVPATACVSWVPLAAPPDVLTYSDFRVSGFCQYSGATSITT